MQARKHSVNLLPLCTAPRFAQASKPSLVTVCWSCILGSRVVCVCPGRAGGAEKRVGHETNSPPWEGGQLCVLQNSRAGTLGENKEPAGSGRDAQHRGRIFATRAITPFWFLYFYVHFFPSSYFKELIYF